MATKKSASKKTVTKKAATKKAVATKAVKKAAVKKAAVKKAAVNKAAAAVQAVMDVVEQSSPKEPAKKATTKKTVTKKVAAEKAAPAKKAATRLTKIVAEVDLGWGNNLYIRGEGANLSWSQGHLMDWVDGVWTWSTTQASGELEFKFLINDEIWCEGENLSVKAGDTSKTSPLF